MSDATTPKPADCYDYDPALLTVEQAQSRIMALSTPITQTQRLPIMEALGRVLAEPVISPINVPPHRNSAMDGYAVRSEDLPDTDQVSLQVIGTSWAGKPFDGTVERGQCVRIMTGAKMPTDVDTVIMQEQVQRNDDNMTIGSGHMAGQNVRHPGEDIAEGSHVLIPGQRLGPAELGLLASLGIADVDVKQRLRVAFFSTGDELKPVGTKLGPGQIYDSNRYTLYGMLSQAGVEVLDMGVIADDPTAIENAFREASEKADVIITSGGVSVGEADFTKTTLDKLGKVDFWRISMKPGKPLAFGKINQAIFFGLPGNPVSVMATFYLFALPALKQMMGQIVTPPLIVKATSMHSLKKRPGRQDYQRGVLTNNEGRLVVNAAGMQASHILSGMSQANCFIMLPMESGNVEAGTEVDVMPFQGLLD